MLSLNKILVPVDFSDRATGATHQAAALARHFHSELVLLHAWSPTRYFAGGLEGAYVGPDPEDLEAQDRQHLDRFLEDELHELPLRRVQVEGDPARRIVEFAAKEKISLIVMPTHGYGPFRRFILGSVTAKVLHDVGCPVWTGVHLAEAPPAKELPVRNVLCAIDLGSHSRQTLCWAAQMAAEFGARLGLVHALPPFDAGSGFFVPEWRNAMVADAAEKIDKLQQDLGTQAEVFIESGEAPKVVRMAAEQFPADVLVIGRTPDGLTGRLRTHAYAIIRESPCPVVSV